MRRGSYFYVIDAFIASIIILAALIVIFSRFFSQQPSAQAFYTAEDFLSTIERTPVVTLDDPRIRTWINDGNITNPQLSTIEQLVYFRIQDQIANPDTTNANDLATIIAASAPTKVGIIILADGQPLYNQTRGATPLADANTMLTAKRVIVLKSTPYEVHPPMIIEVRTWQ